MIHWDRQQNSVLCRIVHRNLQKLKNLQKEVDKYRYVYSDAQVFEDAQTKLHVCADQGLFGVCRLLCIRTAET